jgi:hypothetical protein
MAWTLSNCLPPLRFATGCHQRLWVPSPAKADDPRDHPSDCARITLPCPPCTLWGPGDESHLLSHPLGVRSLTWGMASVALLTGDTTAGQAAARRLTCVRTERRPHKQSVQTETGTGRMCLPLNHTHRYTASKRRPPQTGRSLEHPPEASGGCLAFWALAPCRLPCYKRWYGNVRNHEDRPGRLVAGVRGAGRSAHRPDVRQMRPCPHKSCTFEASSGMRLEQHLVIHHDAYQPDHPGPPIDNGHCSDLGCGCHAAA